MKYLLMIPRVLWKLWFLLNFLIFLLLLYPIFLVLLSREKWFGAAFWLMGFWAKELCYVSGIFPSVKYEGASGLHDQSRPCVFVSNHSSYLDILLSFFVIRQYFIFVGKQELDKAPLFRIFFKQMHILVNRKSTMDSHRAYIQAGERLDKGESVFIFPEATISSKGVLIPFKNGAFKLAIDKQAPIVPIVFHDNWKLLQNGGFLTANGRPGRPRAEVLKPIETRGMTNADLISLREKVKNIMYEALHSQNTR